MASLHLTFGACLDGAILSTMLYGVTLGQACSYFRTYRDDRRFLKFTVAIVFLLDTLQQFLIWHSMWYYLVARCNGDPEGYLFANWSYLGQIVPSEVVFYVVQCFYIRRIWMLSKRRMTFLLLLPATFEIVFSTVYTVQFYEFPSFTDLDESAAEHRVLKALLCSIVSCAIVADLGIAISMSILLRKAQRHTLTGSRSVVGIIIKYTIATGALITVFMIIFLACVLALPGTMIFVGIYFVLGKLYVNSMLAVLNGREALRTRLGNVHTL